MNIRCNGALRVGLRDTLHTIKSILSNITVKHSNRTIIFNTVWISNYTKYLVLIIQHGYILCFYISYVVCNCLLASYIDLMGKNALNSKFTCTIRQHLQLHSQWSLLDTHSTINGNPFLKFLATPLNSVLYSIPRFALCLLYLLLRLIKIDILL